MKDDGGPAFPCDNTASVAPGLTKREWFAGMALVGLSAACRDYEAAAVRCYRFADAMLEAGKQEVREDDLR